MHYGHINSMKDKTFKLLKGVKNMKKKLLSLLLVLVMCFGVLPISPVVSANESELEPENWTREGDFYFTIYDNQAAVCSYVGNDTEVIVPSAFKGRDVTYFNAGLLDDCPVKDNVTSIYFPSTIYAHFEYEWYEWSSGYYVRSGFNLRPYKSLCHITISLGNPFYKDVYGCVLSKDGKTLWYVPNKYDDSFSTSKFSTVTDIRNIGSETIEKLTIGKNIKSIDMTGIYCENLKELYITTKTDNVYESGSDEDYGYIPKIATIYCYKSSGAYKYFKKLNNFLKEYIKDVELYSIVTEPKKPEKSSIKSIEYKKFEAKDSKEYSVKITVKDVGATGYKIYRYDSKSKKYEYLGKAGNGYGSLVYVDKTAKPSKNYKYKVASYNKANKLYSYQSKSSAKSITPKLPKPKKLSFTATYSPEVKGVSGSDFISFKLNKKSCSGYKLYRWNSSKKKYAVIDTSWLSYNYDLNVKKGKTYTYKIRAFAKSSTGKIVYGPYSEKVKVKCK